MKTSLHGTSLPPHFETANPIVWKTAHVYKFLKNKSTGEEQQAKADVLNTPLLEALITNCYYVQCEAGERKTSDHLTSCPKFYLTMDNTSVDEWCMKYSNYLL